MKTTIEYLCTVFTLLAVGTTAVAQQKSSEARTVRYYGYNDCIQLANKTTRVILCPAAGGRVLEYSLHGKNALYLPKGAEGWRFGVSKKPAQMTAGRFDIGPEQVVPRREHLWQGKWSGKITGPRSARLTSVKDKSTGVQLIRDFKLASDSTRLECKQTIRNISKTSKEYCHWSRTFALGYGTVVIPLTKPRRFPHGYVMYGPGPAINFRPVDPNIYEKDGFLLIKAAPKYPKLGMDTFAGWFAYLMKNDVMFVKRFPTYPDRAYNEVAGLTMSIWYPSDAMCELEPIGPREKIAPGKSASFTETWFLLPRKFPKKSPVNPTSVARQVAREAPK